MLQVLVGATQYDAANYVRQQIEDIPGLFVPDSALAAYVQPVAEEFSASLPLEAICGDPQGWSSPLQTIANQQRYVLSPANGFPQPPIFVTRVSYLASYFGAITVQNEIALQEFLAATSAGSASIFQVVADSPTTRHIRDLGLDELSRYNRSFFDVVFDATTGLPALDLYPVPGINGMPIVVRYKVGHQVTTSSGNYLVPTVPAGKTWLFARLLLLTVLEEEADRMNKQRMQKAGLVELQADTRQMEQRINRLREDIAGKLGTYTGAGFVSN